MNKLRVLLADDHKMMREGLRVLVNSQSDMEIVGEADNGRVAMALAVELNPDVVVMDISMPEMNGLMATRKLKQVCREIKILALTRHADDNYLEQFLQAGGCGYVLKISAVDELVRAIRAAAAGKMYLDPEMTEHLAETVAVKRTTSGPVPGKDLSQREKEVLRCTALGYVNKEIAERLAISVRTVEAHKANAMQKMGMKSRIDIVRYAILKGWLQGN